MHSWLKNFFEKIRFEKFQYPFVLKINSADIVLKYKKKKECLDSSSAPSSALI